MASILYTHKSIHKYKPIKMATKKAISKKATQQKSTMIKIAEKVGELAGRIVNEKDHLVAMADGAIESVKATVHNITAPKKNTLKKAAKKIVKKVAKKIVEPSAKKIKKAASAKKVPAAKKTIKKAVKSTAKKITGKK